jgi:hypothetical protein
VSWRHIVRLHSGPRHLNHLPGRIIHYHEPALQPHCTIVPFPRLKLRSGSRSMHHTPTSGNVLPSIARRLRFEIEATTNTSAKQPPIQMPGRLAPSPHSNDEPLVRDVDCVGPHPTPNAGGVEPCAEVVEAGFCVAFFAGELVMIRVGTRAALNSISVAPLAIL